MCWINLSLSCFFFFKQKTAYEMRISDWSSDVCSSDLGQYGVGLKYQATAVTNIGVYWLRYHSTTPAPIQNYGYAPLVGGVDGVPTVASTQLLNLKVDRKSVV